MDTLNIYRKGYNSSLICKKGCTENTLYSPFSLAHFQDFVKGNKPYVKASAVVGLSGLQQIVYNGIMKITGREIKSFSTLAEAKDWLAARN